MFVFSNLLSILTVFAVIFSVFAGPDGTPLPTDASGAVNGPNFQILADGTPLPTDAGRFKRFVPNGTPLPTDAFVGNIQKDVE